MKLKYATTIIYKGEKPQTFYYEDAGLCEKFAKTCKDDGAWTICYTRIPNINECFLEYCRSLN